MSPSAGTGSSTRCSKTVTSLPRSGTSSQEIPDAEKPPRDGQLSGQIGYLVDLAKSHFLSNNDQGIDADELAQGGYEIHTTFEKDKVES